MRDRISSERRFMGVNEFFHSRAVNNAVEMS